MQEQDEITKQWFDASTVKVEWNDDLTEFFDDEAIIGLSGALSGSRVTVQATYGAPLQAGDPQALESIRLEVHHDAVFSMVRRVTLDVNGRFHLENAKFRIRHDYGGRNLAARSLTLQARAAQTLGLESLRLDAIGDYATARFRFPEDRWVGYWVWPRLGFDAPLSQYVREHLPWNLRNSTRVSELMTSEEGLTFWELNGENLYGAKFDLAPNSISWQLLSKYSQERNIKA